MIRLISRKNLPTKGTVTVSPVIAANLGSLSEQKHFLLHVPLLVLGDSRAGKTSTVKSLTGKQFDHCQAKTHGVETVSVKNEDGNWKTITDAEVFNYDLMRSKLIADTTANIPENQTYKNYRMIIMSLFDRASIVTGLQNNNLFKAVIISLMLSCFILSFGLFWLILLHLTVLSALEVVTYLETRNFNIMGYIFLVYGILLGSVLGFSLLSPLSDVLSHFYGGQAFYVVFMLFLAEFITRFFHYLLFESRAPLVVQNCLDYLNLKTELNQMMHGGVLGGVLSLGMSYQNYMVQVLICCCSLLVLKSMLLLHRHQIAIPTLTLIATEMLFLGITLAQTIWPMASALPVSGVLFGVTLTPLVVGYSNWISVKQILGFDSFTTALFNCDTVFAEAQKMLFTPEIMQDVNSAILSPKQSILDFAGDEDYYIYHHLFLSPESVYLVVFNIQLFIKDNFKAIKERVKRLRFWLESICTHTPPDTPIFIVGTHQGTTEYDLLRRLNVHLKQGLWDSFCDSIETNAERDFVYFPIENSESSHDKSINLLRQAVDQAVKELTGNLETNVPLCWIKLSEDILRLRSFPKSRLCVTLEKFEQMCLENDVPSEQIKDVLNYLHQHKMVVYFAHDDLLSKWVLLDPQLLVNIIVHLVKPPSGIDKKRGFRRYWDDLNTKGFLAEPLLDHILSSLGEDKKAVKAFLEASDLICRLPCPAFQKASSGAVQYTHFLPQKLPVAKVSTSSPIWNRSSTDLKFFAFFERFIPAALFHHLQSRAYKQSQVECPGSSPVVQWHVGVFWLMKRQPFKITLLEDEGLVEIVFSRIDGGVSPSDVLSLVWHMIDSICRQHFKHLRFHCGPLCPSVTCPGHPDTCHLPSPRPHVFNILPARQNRSQIDLKCCNHSFELKLQEWIP